MRIVYLSEIETFIVDILAWVFFHLSIGFTFSRLSIQHFNPSKSWFQTKNWEKDGQIYQKLFKVKNWKKIIPSGAAIYKNAYEVKHLTEITIENINLWIRESCRSEVCHWLMMIPGGLFYLWNSVEVGRLMVVYAFANNIVPIIMQRYNRPRARKLLAQMEKKLALNDSPQFSYEYAGTEA